MMYKLNPFKNDKEKLRNYCKKQILSIKKQDKEINDNKIFLNILNSDLYNKSNTICVYISTTQEIDTTLLITQMIKDGKTVVVPKCVEHNGLILIKTNTLNNLKPNKYGILEPLTGKEVPSKCVELFLIPGYASDKNKNRLGKGGGYYDKLLVGVSGIKAMLCYSDLCFDEIRSEKHDIKMDYIITERGLI